MVRSKFTFSEPTCQWRRSCQHEGFSVVELLITISIIGILTAISIPNILGQLPKYRLNGAARQVMGELMAARMKAVSQNRNVKVFFVNSHEYKVCDDADNDGIVNTNEGSVRNRDLRTDYSDVELTATSDPQFNTRGATANLITITLSNSPGSKNITVNISGHVKIN
ncbi:MAG: GspH/FimT family pseudopilin [Nitrososphaera sp.]